MKKYQNVPDTLKRLLIFRAVLILVVCILSALVLLMRMNTLSIAACLIIISGVVASYMMLHKTIVNGGFLVIEGECVECISAGIRRRAKRVLIATDAGSVEIRPREHIRVGKGDWVRAFVSGKSRVYTQESKKIIIDYLVMEKQTKSQLIVRNNGN